MTREAQAGLAEAGVLSAIRVILTLAAVLESLRQPARILVAIPLALIGTTWALPLAGRSFSVLVILGIMTMIGIVVNNAILVSGVHTLIVLPRSVWSVHAQTAPVCP